MPDGSATTTEQALLDRGAMGHRDVADSLEPRPGRSLDAAALRRQFLDARSCTERLAEPLSAEDAAAQSMPDASPTKWHLAHTTWFFETFVLSPLPGYRQYDPSFSLLFNSYYESLGARLPRPCRGLVTRPSLDVVIAYRRAVTLAVASWLETSGAARPDALAAVELGIHHEQQHQELILTDIKHLLSHHPCFPAYHSPLPRGSADEAPPLASPASGGGSARYTKYDGGLVSLGHRGGGFAFDNESPEHRVFVRPFALGAQLVTNGEYLEFIADGGYRRPELWLSDGFHWVAAHDAAAPLYWQLGADGSRQLFTLSGLMPLDLAEPVCHVSYYEADAYARWAAARLPTEAEWEHAARTLPLDGNFLDSGCLHPRAARRTEDTQTFGDTWEWTASAYAPYPGFRALPGALGEYNGKFMCNQMVLRGGSCATPREHVRASYRNFFPPPARWQFTGIRLAKDA